MFKTRELDLTKGSLFKELIIFSLPILGINVLQLLFNTADIFVLGHFAAPERATIAVASVGATGSLINLLIGFFVGISLGANVVVAKSKGAGDLTGARRYVGCSVMLSFVAGVMLLIVGVLGAKTFLTLMNLKGELLDMATDYLRIYFLGMPIIMLYNFSASVLRAVGDTFRPLMFLVIGGVLNVILNIFFVTVVGLDVEGVAIATVASNFVSAVCCLTVMLKSNGYAKLDLKCLKFYKKELKDILYIGVPCGFQSVFFNLANVIIQSNVNSFGSMATAGNSVANEIDRYIYYTGNAIAISTLSFTSQNMGAQNFVRIKATIKLSAFLIFLIGLILGAITILFCEPLCLLIRNDINILPYAKERLYVMASTYFLCGFMDMFSYVLRGMGKSVLSMIISLLGGCLLRILFIFLASWLFPDTFFVLFLAYPISWILTMIVLSIVVFHFLKIFEKEYAVFGRDVAEYAKRTI